MFRIINSFGIIVLLSCFIVAGASANSCAPSEETKNKVALKDFDRADIVFLGQVISSDFTTDQEGKPYRVVSFKVIKPYKGVDQANTTVKVYTSNKRKDFANNAKGLVVAAYKQNEILYTPLENTNWCVKINHFKDRRLTTLLEKKTNKTFWYFLILAGVLISSFYGFRLINKSKNINKH